MLEVRFTWRRVLLVVFVGCVLIAIIGSMLFVRFEMQVSIPVGLAVEVARSSQRVANSLGTPISVGRLTTGHLVSWRGNGTADLIIPVHGPQASGELREWAQEQDGRWQVCSLFMRFPQEAKDIELVPDASSTCERE
jgi:hypothetical protein